MLSTAENTKLSKAFIKVSSLQQQLSLLRKDQPDIKPIDAATALLEWFQEPDNEHVRLDTLYYAISHLWHTSLAKLDSKAALNFLNERTQNIRASKTKTARAVGNAADEAVEQVVATLLSMTFKQARMIHKIASQLDLTKGRDDQKLSDVFSKKVVRAALK